MGRAFLSIAVLTVLQGVTTTIQAAEPAKPPSDQPASNELLVGKPIRHDNLTIFPIMSRTLRNADRFVTLDEGLKAGTVEILESGAAARSATVPGNAQQPAPDAAAQTVQQGNQQAQQGNQRLAAQSAGGNNVNQLFVVNKSEKPLYLMPGEIIIGGAQDRAIAQEYLIQPTNKLEPIKVFCVEHGRWGARSHQDLALFATTATARSERSDSVTLSGGDVQLLARQANEGKFVGSVGQLSKGARIAVQEGGSQSAVWSEVGKENSKSSVKSKSGAFTGNYAEKEAVERLDPYIAKLQAPIAEQPQVVGVIVAVNDKMDSAEVLESTPLFKKLWPKLLKSYALGAANSKANVNAKADEPAKPACTRDEAVAFLAELQSAGTEAGRVADGIATSRHIGPRLSASNAYDPKAAPAAPGGMGGFGGGIHSQGFSK